MQSLGETMTQDFYEKLIITIVDKGLLTLLIAIAAFSLNKILEKYKSKQALENELIKQKQVFGNELAKQRDTIRLQFLERQLSEFYWPIYLRLQKDNAVWRRILDRKKDDELLRQVGTEIEKSYILPNHDEIIKIIESKIHLAKADDKLLDALLRYMRHIAVYKSMRVAGIFDKDPLDLQEPWPRDFFPAIEERIKQLQHQYDNLLAVADDA